MRFRPVDIYMVYDSLRHQPQGVLCYMYYLKKKMCHTFAIETRLKLTKRLSKGADCGPQIDGCATVPDERSMNENELSIRKRKLVWMKIVIQVTIVVQKLSE